MPAGYRSQESEAPVIADGVHHFGAWTEPSHHAQHIDDDFTFTSSAAYVPNGEDVHGVAGWTQPEHAEVLTPAPQRRLLVLGCRGVQVGDGNTQFNTYTYQMQDPPVDFAVVLRLPAVRAALRRLILDPDNDVLRQEAEDALRAGPWYLLKKDTLDLGPLERNALSGAAAAELPEAEGFITVRNCQGVQLGDGCVQQNDFTYVCRRPTVNVHALLKEPSKVASSLVDAVINPPAPERAESLNFAVKSALLSRDTVAAIPDRSLRLPAGTNFVRDRDGVSIGNRCETHEFKALMVDLRKPEILDDSVANEFRYLNDLAKKHQSLAHQEPTILPDTVDDATEPWLSTLETDLHSRGDGFHL
ncbi:RIP homotypic interaction motif-containing protein [Streptomyces rameus]